MSTDRQQTLAELRRQLKESRGQLRQAQEQLQEARRQLRRERLEKTRLWKELRDLGLAEQVELARRCAEELRARLRDQVRRGKP